jgi:hypothetical protein
LILWEKFNQENNHEKCLEYDDGARLNELEATELIQGIIVVKMPTEIQRYEKKKRNLLIKKLKDQGLPIRQIARLTGISYGVYTWSICLILYCLKLYSIDIYPCNSLILWINREISCFIKV